MWVVTGDGDALSIGGNHLIHALRRNINLKILLFDNRIYGLTKGQYSPTSRGRQDHQVDADGVAGHPVQPGLAGARRGGHLRRPHHGLRPQAPAVVLRAAAAHQGTALVEIYQNCNIFNDGAFELLKDAGTRDDWTIRLEHGQPIRFGRDGSKAVVREPVPARWRSPRTCPRTTRAVVVHDAHTDDPSYAFALSRLSGSDLRYTPMGVFRSVERPTYDDLLNEQVDRARAATTPDLAGLLAGADTWTVY